MRLYLIILMSAVCLFVIGDQMGCKIGENRPALATGTAKTSGDDYVEIARWPCITPHAKDFGTSIRETLDRQGISYMEVTYYAFFTVSVPASQAEAARAIFSRAAKPPGLSLEIITSSGKN